MKRNKIISKKMIILIIVVLMLAACVHIWKSNHDTQQETKRVLRDSYGGVTKTEVYQVEIDGKEEQVEIRISPRVYSDTEIQKLFEKAMEELDKVVLGDNDSSDYMTKNLVLPTKLENYPFVISWEFSRYDVLGMSGELIQEELEKVDPDKQGVQVTVKGTLTYETHQAQYQMEALLFAEEKELEPAEELQKLVESVDEETRETEYLNLPQEWNGKTIVWKKEAAGNVPILIVLGLVVGLLLVLREKQKEAKQKKEKKEEMLIDYPEIISQFTMLMGAGMTAKRVWAKVAEDYRRERDSSGKSRAAYEEILFTWQEMQSGIPEAQCYERFAKRCELLPYMKMGVLLAQNLRKGSRGLSEMLSLEAIEAMEERKNRARRLGEEAGTKLLIPMMIMLIVVLAIVVVPAFWSAQI